MQPISELIQNTREEFEKARLNYSKRRIVVPSLTKDDFIELLTLECSIRLFARGSKGEYDFDDFNIPVIDQLYFYITGNVHQFKGDLTKGLMIQGPIGSGKTILLRGFAGVVGKLLDRQFEYYSAFDLNKLVVKEGMEKYSKRPMLIDDLGKEQELIKDYGTDVRPILELFASRYDNGAITYITTNYSMETFAKKYGVQTVDRFTETLNMFLLGGKSRRK